MLNLIFFNIYVSYLFITDLCSKMAYQPQPHLQTNRTNIPQFLEQYQKIHPYKIELIEYVFYLFKHHGHYTPNTDLEILVEFIEWCKSHMVANDKYTDDFIRTLFANGAIYLNHEPMKWKCRKIISNNGVNIKKFRKYASELSKFRADIYIILFSDILLFEYNEQIQYEKERMASYIVEYNEQIRYKKELFDAAQCGDDDTVRRIMGNRHPSIRNSDILRSLIVAIWNEFNDVVHIFIHDKIIQVYLRLQSFDAAVIYNNYSIVESLIDLRVNVDNYDYYDYERNNSALYIATENCSNVNIIELLINSKANVNNVDNMIYRQTPLHIATKNRSIEIVKRLLDAKSNVNIADNMIYRQTPLHVATKNRSIEIVKMLLYAKSDFNAISCELGPNTPLQIAQVNGYDEILMLFR